FTVTLKGHPMFAPTLPVTFTLDGVTLTTKSAANVSFTKAGDRWTLKHAVFEPGEKQPGAEGPISTVTAARHIYVYGTSDSPSNDELLRCQRQATFAATWSPPKRPLLTTFSVIA